MGRLSHHDGGNEQQKRTTDGSAKDCGTFSDEQHGLPPVGGFCGGTVSSSDKGSMKMRKRNVSGCKEVHEEPVKSRKLSAHAASFNPDAAQGMN
jgi:hypothetical protein